MKIFLLGVVATIALVPSTSQAQNENPLFELVRKSRVCADDSLSGDIDCEYRVGSDLHVVIAGVGTNYTGIDFHKSNFDGDYWASVAVKHGCVVVFAGPKAPKKMKAMASAFISPKNGKVYRTWPQCQSAD